MNEIISKNTIDLTSLIKEELSPYDTEYPVKLLYNGFKMNLVKARWYC